MAGEAEKRAEVKAILDEVFGPVPLPRSKVVARDGEVIRDADVQVSPKDVNYQASAGGSVMVRRPEYVTINFAAYERQGAERAEERRRRRDLDPCRLGLYGPTDEDD
jgi:hypothetical protein